MGRLIVLAGVLWMTALWSFSAQAAAVILYFPSNYSASAGAPANVTQVVDFPPICQDGSDIYEMRLPGLDAVRGFSEGAVCQINTVQGRFNSQADYVFLVDDTAELSDYLKTQMRQKNVLQTVNGREVIRPTVINFESSGERQGFKVLTVGEVAYQSAGNQAAWLTALNQRFSQNEMVAGGQASSGADDDIWIAYHGSFYNKRLELIEDVSLEKIAQYFQSKWDEMTQQFGTGGTPSPGQPPGTAPPTSPTPTMPPPTPGRAMNDYMRMCNSEGVPIPPPWNPTSGTNQWQRQGVQSTLFISQTFTTEVWKYQSTNPAGICLALPRMENGSDINQNIELLGIICQSEASGKACFWDNVERPTPEVSSGQPETTAAEAAVRRPGGRARITGAATRDMDPINMSDGYNLTENCTACHRGDNVYLIHPGTTIDAGDTDHNGSRYAPISGQPASPAWRNPTLTLSTAESSTLSGCSNGGCHAMPGLSFDFCGLLNSAIGNTMPQGRPANWRTTHAPEVRLLANRCCDLGQRNDDGDMEYFNIKQYANAGACLTSP